MNLDLSELSQLAPIFRELFKGYHVSRRDPELYAQLSNFQDQYRMLFKALGFELVCDTRGFFYFVPDSATPQVNKTAQRLALFTFILVEHLADQGRDPIVMLDGGSLGRDELPSLLEKYRDLFLQAEVQTSDELEEVRKGVAGISQAAAALRAVRLNNSAEPFALGIPYRQEG